jgi:class 3 adenylate cyclase
VWFDIWRNKINDENISFGLKCGINTGYALVGYIPTKERDEFTAVGSRVNLASRLEKKRPQAIRYCIIKYKRKNSV